MVYYSISQQLNKYKFDPNKKETFEIPIILIHKCGDGKSSNYIYYTVHRDLLIESALQIEEIISTRSVLKLKLRLH